MRFQEKNVSGVTSLHLKDLFIVNKLREKSGVSVELYRLYQPVEAGSIKVRGQEYDVSKVKDQVYSQLAGVIASDLDRLWSEDWDIDTIVLTGGGGKELAKYLQPLISGNVRPIENNIDSRLNNVQGYLKYGKHIWTADTSAETPPQPPPK